ncbi:MAG TPA: branched-chain amino acid ABC transporter permease/ATP-binding protein [Acidimicrobiales bacterium]|nr:branched-chain amino acid ABC transporter permease/ATP-binding protein [Acidimicrobiales bacterium]
MTRVFVSLVLSLPLVGAYGIFAIGIVLIYRASRMLNLAHGAMAMVPAYLLYAMVRVGIPVVIALPLGILAGALLGLAVEKVFVSRLRPDGPTAQTVGTVAVLGLLVAVAARIWGTASLDAVRVFPAGRVDVGLSSIQYGEIGLFIVMLVLAGALFALIQRTDIGLIMRGTAESRLAASLMGVNPDRITSMTWALGGALAALAGILLAAVTSLHPYNLALQVLPAFIAALIGGLGSLPGALVGATIVGVTQGLVPVIGFLGELQGAPQFLLAVLSVVVMATRGKALVAADDAGAADAPTTGAAVKRAQRSEAQASGGRIRNPNVALLVVALVVAFPFFPKVPSSIVGTANLAAIYAIIAVSLVLLTGWVGQISLGHAALVGIGAYSTGHIAEGLGIPFPLSLPLAAACGAAAAAILGGVALRVRGLYLAVATLVFSWMASEFLFRQDWFTKHDQVAARAIGKPDAIPYFDFTDRRVFWLVAVGILGGVVFTAACVRDSKTGRAFFALRGSEMAAASLGIDVMRYKLLAFVVSGAIAGAAGNLMMTDAGVVSGDQFTFNISLFFVAIAVVGGLTSLPGAVASGVLFAALAEVFYRVQALGAFLEIVSSLLLAVVLIAYRGGLASVPDRFGVVADRLEPVLKRLREKVFPGLGHSGDGEDTPEGERAKQQEPGPVAAFFARMRASVRGFVATLPLGRFRPSPTPASVTARPPIDFKDRLRMAAPSTTNGSAHATPQPAENGAATAPPKIEEGLLVARGRVAEFRPTGPREERELLIEARDITVRFGGLTAVNEASLEVRENEIVGLIGPNGAGKTTFFNAIAGYNTPASGTISLYGEDVTALPVHRRARVGVARTFQLIQLFRQLTVYENLLVATHVHNPTGIGSHVGVTRKALEAEQAAVERVDEILELLDLSHLANRSTGDLPFGVLRMIEVARALVTGFSVVMLDEPASGLDNSETDKLIEVLRFVRGLGVTLLLIEHDVRMVTGVSDYLYVLDQGRIIAHGVPEEIQRNPEVIAAYLGEPVKETVG